MTVEVDKMFATPTGKRYHGVRYPQGGTIRPPFCVVTVLPEHVVSQQCYAELTSKVIEKLPEVEFWLSEQEIYDAIGASIILAGLSGIGGK